MTGSKDDIKNADRITIMIQLDLQKKVRDMQADIIKKYNKSVSTSAVINSLLLEGSRTKPSLETINKNIEGFKKK